MQRVVVLGRGGAGKSTAAERLGLLTGLPVVELDRHFWNSDLTPMPEREWIHVQEGLAARPRWIMDGDLGQYDVLGPRLVAADTVLVLDFSSVRCIWRAARRSRERADFWWWVLRWRYRSRPALLQAVATYAPTADLRIVRNPRALQRLWVQIEAARPGGRHRGRFAQHSGTRTLPDPPHGPTPGLNECRPGTLSATEADGPHRQRHECAFIG